MDVLRVRSLTKNTSYTPRTQEQVTTPETDDYSRATVYSTAREALKQSVLSTPETEPKR